MPTSAQPPGYITPTSVSYPNGAGNPRDAAISSGQQMNAKQSNMNAIGGTRRRRRKTKRVSRKTRRTRKRVSRKRGKRGIRRRRGGGVAAPQYQMSYTPTGGPGTNPNDQISNMTSTNMQSAAWKVNDQQASQK